MTNEQKLEQIADALEVEQDELQPDMVLEEVETWDSVAVLSIISVMNEEFNKYPSARDILECKTVRDLMNLMNE